MFGSSKAQPLPLQNRNDRSQVGVFDDAKNAFAEIYGGSMVTSARNWVLALAAIVLAGGMAIGWAIQAQSNVAVPVLVEVNSQTGVVNKPVRIERIKPPEAAVKAELGRWVAKIFTIDSTQTQRLFREANLWTRGLGTSQFTDFRVKQNVIERMAKDASLQRSVKVTAVDVSQPGVALAYVRTQEAQGSNANSASSTWRVNLKYEFDPPTTEEAIQFNPLGIYITSVVVIEEAGK